METVLAFVQGLMVVALPVNLLLLVIGITVGMIIGTIPGISAASGIALLVPLTHTFGLAPESALILYAGVYYGSKYAGRIPAILLDIPGDVSSLATRFDGYPLAMAGQAGRALALTAVSSFVGGTLAIVVLILIGGLFVGGQTDLDDFLGTALAELDRDADEEVLHAVFALEEHRAGIDDLLILEDRFHHLRGRGAGCIPGACADQLGNLRNLLF